MRKLSLFVLISLFAGSTVVVAARDIERRLAPPTEADRVAVREIVKDIQGENVIPAVKAAMDKNALPDRNHGSYLVKKDIERIKKFLVSLVKSEGTSAESVEEQK